MVRDERGRHYGRLEGALGPEAATTLMEQLPPAGWSEVATKADLNALADRIDARFERVDARFERVDVHFESVGARFLAAAEVVEARFQIVDIRLAEMEARVGYRFDSVDERLKALKSDLTGTIHEAVGSLRAELSAQTRLFIFTTLTAVLATAGIAIGAG